jgi:hypothetical protein
MVKTRIDRVAAERYAAWNDFVRRQNDDTIPHCDSRILHYPADCEYCARPKWTERRVALKIAFTGRDAVADEVPCEADATRPRGAENDHRRWAGNKPTSATGDASWPRETGASVLWYGDKGGRETWPLRERIQLRLWRPIQYVRYRLKGYRRVGMFWVFRGDK